MAATVLARHLLRLSPRILPQKFLLPRFSSLSNRISLYHPSLLLLQSCRTLKELKQIHAHFIVSGLCDHPFSLSRLIKCSASPDSGCIDYALLIFRYSNSPDTFTYNTLIKALSLSSDPGRCVAFYYQMLAAGAIPNSYTFPPLANACGRAGAVGDGEKIHGQAVKNGVDAILFVQNSLMHMYSCLGLLDCTRQLFDEMKMQLTDVKATDRTIVNALTGCGRSARLLEGRSVHGYLVKNDINFSLIIGTALMDMYGRCGRVDLAHKLFCRMPKKNVVSWNVMIMAHATHGHGMDAITLFEEMRSSSGAVIPDEVTFIGVLCACAHLGAADHGQRYFDMMSRDYGVTPSFAHYWCLANLYGGIGLVQEAEEIIKSMPMESESFFWGGLLSFCRFHGDVDLGEKIAKKLIELEPYNSARYTLLLNVYAVAGRWEDVLKLKETMKERGLKNLTSCSLIDLNTTVHDFVAGDKSRPEMQEIYLMMDEVAKRLNSPPCDGQAKVEI
ncbi:Pentatricopeptide repeat-containing protein [Nymphaea thermarum]|nr:Pentatricopeptide repeat-containing protein [Nymphaea thermarum]